MSRPAPHVAIATEAAPVPALPPELVRFIEALAEADAEDDYRRAVEARTVPASPARSA